MFFKTLLIGAGLVDLSIAGYVLQDNYNPSNFFSQFDFFTVSSSYRPSYSSILINNRVTIRPTVTLHMQIKGPRKVRA